MFNKLFSKNLFVNLFLVSIILALQIPLIQPFFHTGFFTSHDDVQVVRVFEYFQSLDYNQIPPRWSAGLLYGHGYPLYIFYAPFIYILGSIFVYLGFNFLIATKIVFILTFIIGALGIFFLVREFFGKIPAFVSSIVFSLAPYRAVDVYVRGNLTEFFSLSFFPWVFLSNYKIYHSERKFLWMIIFILTLSVLIISHNISFFIFALFLSVYNLFELLKFKKPNYILFKYLILSGIVSLGLTCFYWLPLIYETQFVKIDEFADFPYNEYYLSFSQIWQSSWGYGGFLDPSPMSLQLGKVLIMFSVLTFIVNFFINTKFKSFINFIFAVFVFSLLLETKTTSLIWDNLTILHFMQFPWRLHILATLSSSILTGAFLYLLLQQKINRLIKSILLFLIIVIIGFFSYQESFNFFKPREYYNTPPVSETTTWHDEYMPKWVKIKPAEYAADKIKFIKGSGSLSNIEWGYSTKQATINSSQEDSVIEIAHVYYPGWNAYINGKVAQINYNQESGLMQINIPKGENTILFEFKNTWWRNIADLTSIATLLIFILLILFRKSSGYYSKL